MIERHEIELLMNFAVQTAIALDIRDEAKDRRSRLRGGGRLSPMELPLSGM